MRKYPCFDACNVGRAGSHATISVPVVRGSIPAIAVAYGWKAIAPPVLDRLGLVCAGAIAPSGLASLARPSGGRSSPEPLGMVCAEPMQRVLDLAATAEALSITFYYRAIVTPGGFFGRLRGEQQGYLRVALDQERFHYDYLIGRGAQPLATMFYFPADTFSFNGFPIFLAAMDAVETASIGLYLAAARRLGELGSSLLAEIVEQILGVEAEHRVIGRELAQNAPPPPNDRCFERATAGCVAWAFEPLQRFLNGDATAAGPFELPSGAEIASAVGSSTCTPVPAAMASNCQETVPDILSQVAGRRLPVAGILQLATCDL